LGLLWNVIIPILPATFLLSPLLWRAVCPLATLNMWPGGRTGKSPMTGKMQQRLGIVGLLLLALLVPARRFLFNEDGLALAIVIVAVAGVAIGVGALYRNRAGFCNSLCPVLPVEKLYGQHPLVAMKDSRCASCVRCIPKGCLDVSPRKAIQQSIDARPPGTRWIASPYGVFAGAFPGFVLGYFSTENGPLSTAGGVYLEVFAYAAAGYLGVAALCGMFRLGIDATLTVLAALAVGTYYWFAAPASAAYLGLSPTAGILLRGLALMLVAYWSWRAFVRWPAGSRPRPDPE
jgi:hypothetical protein